MIFPSRETAPVRAPLPSINGGESTFDPVGPDTFAEAAEPRDVLLMDDDMRELFLHTQALASETL